MHPQDRRLLAFDHVFGVLFLMTDVGKCNIVMTEYKYIFFTKFRKRICVCVYTYVYIYICFYTYICTVFPKFCQKYIQMHSYRPREKDKKGIYLIDRCKDELCLSAVCVFQISVIEI